MHMPSPRGEATSPSTPLLEVKGVTLQYKTTEILITATYRVDFNVHRSDRYVLLGPSGCGKATVMKILAGLHGADGGTVKIGNATINDPIHALSNKFAAACCTFW